MIEEIHNWEKNKWENIRVVKNRVEFFIYFGIHECNNYICSLIYL